MKLLEIDRSRQVLLLSQASIDKQKKVLKQKYKRYLAVVPKSKNKLSNSWNLFDDSNIKDRAMFYNAVERIARKQRSSYPTRPANNPAPH